MAKKKKRRGMGKANKKNRQRRSTGKGWLNIPAGVGVFKEKITEGRKDKTIIDIVPYILTDKKNHPDANEIPEDIWWKFPYLLHRNVGPDKTDIVCPKTFGKPCPICEKRQAIFDNPDSEDDAARGLKPSKRTLYVIRDLNNKGEVFIWDISDYCFLEQLDEELDNGNDSLESFADLENGYTLKIRFKGKSIGESKPFAMANRIDFEKRDDISEEALEEFPSLDGIISAKSYDDVKALYLGEEVEPDEDEIEDDEIEDDDDDDQGELDENACVACDGTGKNSKGGKCKPCKGTGLKQKKAEKKESEPEKEDQSLDWDDLIDMDESDLCEVVEEEKLDVDMDDYEDIDELRKLIAEELEIDVPEPKKEKKEKKGKNKKGKCPFNHEFGTDFDEEKECDEDECDQYDACFEAYEALDD